MKWLWKQQNKSKNLYKNTNYANKFSNPIYSSSSVVFILYRSCLKIVQYTANEKWEKMAKDTKKFI